MEPPPNPDPEWNILNSLFCKASKLSPVAWDGFSSLAALALFKTSSAST